MFRTIIGIDDKVWTNTRLPEIVLNNIRSSNTAVTLTIEIRPVFFVEHENYTQITEVLDDLQDVNLTSIAWSGKYNNRILTKLIPIAMRCNRLVVDMQLNQAIRLLKELPIKHQIMYLSLELSCGTGRQDRLGDLQTLLIILDSFVSIRGLRARECRSSVFTSEFFKTLATSTLKQITCFDYESRHSEEGVISSVSTIIEHHKQTLKSVSIIIGGDYRTADELCSLKDMRHLHFGLRFEYELQDELYSLRILNNLHRYSRKTIKSIYIDYFSNTMIDKFRRLIQTELTQLGIKYANGDEILRVIQESNHIKRLKMGKFLNDPTMLVGLYKKISTLHEVTLYDFDNKCNKVLLNEYMKTKYPLYILLCAVSMLPRFACSTLKVIPMDIMRVLISIYL